MNTKLKYLACLLVLPLVMPALAMASTSSSVAASAKISKQGSILGESTSYSDQEAVNAVIIKIGSCAKYTTSEQKVTCLTEVLLDLTKILVGRTSRPAYEDKSIKKTEETHIVKGDFPPIVKALSANKGKIGDTVTIYGNNFKSKSGKVYVSFAIPGKEGFSSIPPIEINDTAIKFKFDERSMLYSSFGDTAGKIIELKLFLTYENDNTQTYTNSIPFYFDGTAGGTIIVNKDATPVISSLSANKGKIGDIVTIYGNGFKAASGSVTVSLYAPDRERVVQLTPVEISDTLIKFKIYDSIGLTEKAAGNTVKFNLFLTYTNGSNKLYSNKLEFYFDGTNGGTILTNDYIPSIKSLSANKGKIGDVITVYGKDFNSVKARGKAYLTLDTGERGRFGYSSAFERKENAITFKIEEKNIMPGFLEYSKGKIVELELFITFDNDDSPVNTNKLEFYFDGTSNN